MCRALPGGMSRRSDLVMRIAQGHDASWDASNMHAPSQKQAQPEADIRDRPLTHLQALSLPDETARLPNWNRSRIEIDNGPTNVSSTVPTAPSHR